MHDNTNNSTPFVLTRPMLEAAGTAQGKTGTAFCRKQFELLGVQYPPSSGWLQALCGKSIDARTYRLLLEANPKARHWQSAGLFEGSEPERQGGPARLPKETKNLLEWRARRAVTEGTGPCGSRSTVCQVPENACTFPACTC